MSILYVDKQEKKKEEFVKYLRCEYEIRDLKYGDFTNEIESFVVERKNWQDYIGSVMDGSLIEQCIKIRKNFSGLAGVIFEGDFWAMIGTIKNQGLRHKLVCTRYRVTTVFGMFFEECIDRVAVATTLEFLNDNAVGIMKNSVGFKKGHVKTTDKRVILLCGVPDVGKKTAEQILKVYDSIFDFLVEAITDPKAVIKAIFRFGPKTLENVLKMFVGDKKYANKVLTKKQYNALKAKHARKKGVYNKLSGGRT